MFKFFLISLALFAVCFAEEESDVIVITEDNFQEYVKDADCAFVEFYAPWCGHCKKLAPDWETVATALKGTCNVAKVDATIESDLAQQFGVRGYPTLKFFTNGKAKDYNGGRQPDALIGYVKKQMAPAVTYIEDAEALEAFKSSDKVVVVGFFASKDSEQHNEFAASAENLRDKFLFGAAIGLAEQASVAENAVVLFKTFDERQNVFEGGSETELAQFLESNSVPLLDELGPENYQRYMDSGLPLGFLFLDGTSENTEVRDAFSAVAKEVKGKVNIAWIDDKKYNAQQGRVGLSGKRVPALAFDDQKGTGFHYAFPDEAEFEVEKAVAWVKSYVAGEVEPTIKSEEIPENNDAPVTVLVQKNFDQIVKDSEKDVLVEFYAPWCGHCKKLAPIYDQVGEAFKDIESVVVAKIDATANDVDPKYGVRGFPTLKFFPANNKENPLTFDKDRTLTAIVDYIKENGATKYELDTTGLKDEL